MKEKVRVRYAPSPTGHLHIGGARTALFNYLFAKHNDGSFIFRLEDTDIERNIEGGEASQLNNLEWLGIIPDESPLNPGAFGPYRQMERLTLYQEYAKKLIETGHAYECYCSSEELEASRLKQEQAGIFSFRYDKKCTHLTQAKREEYIKEGRKPSIRFNVQPDSIYQWQDLVRQEVSFEGKDISDWVILKSSSIPTYNFAVVIDDYTMEISHIFRGEEHISNTPKQLMVYEALDIKPPLFGHLTLIVNEERKKLSKRDETIMQFISQYKEQGYLPDAMFNFFSLLGWSPEVEEEIFTKQEIIEMFDINRLSKSPSMYDKAKLHWVENVYIKKLNQEEYYNLCYPFLEKAYDLNDKDQSWITTLIELYQPQLNYGQEIVSLVAPFFQPFSLNEEGVAFLKEVNAIELFEHAITAFSQLEEFNAVTTKQVINNLGKELDRKGKTLFMPIRLGITGNMKGVDLQTTIELIGQEQVINNLKTSLALLCE
ncbi:MAG: glutamate--tRNA ligase [Bacilli bacterium]